MRIAILGIGGIGGFIGGKLAAYYRNSKDVEIIFIARGESKRVIEENGLKLSGPWGEITAYPSIIESHPEEAGILDVIICCIKSYDLETSLHPFKNCITDGTIILPLLNGVDAAERITNIFPRAKVWKGCIYIVSRLIAPGTVKDSGNFRSLYFGSEQETITKLIEIEDVFKLAGIEAHLSKDINQIVWEKYIFISPLATITSYLDLSIGNILNNEQNKRLLLSLLAELKALAEGKQIKLADNIIEKTLDKISSLPFDATSSMHTDFKKGNKTEVASLTGFVIKEAKELNIPTPVYAQMFAKLSP